MVLMMTMMRIITMMIYIETVSEDVSGEALVFGLPMGGAAGEYDTGPFAPRLWGCLKRSACFGPQHPSLSE